MYIRKGSAFLEWLSTRLAISYLTFGLVVILCIYYLSQHQAAERWKDQARLVTDLVNSELTMALENKDQLRISAILTNIARSVPVSGIQLTTASGKPIAFYPQTSHNRGTILRESTVSNDNTRLDTELANRHRLSIIASSNTGWQGFMEFGMPAVFLTLLLTLLFSLLHYLHLSFTIHQPLTDLLRRIRQIKPERTGNNLLPVHSKAATAPELDEIAVHINQLLKIAEDQQSKRKQVEQELKTHRRNLGKLVQARTAELVELNKRFVQQQFDAKTSALEAKQARWDAEKANQDKTRFLAAASHDLRQPLHAMSLFVEALEPLLATAKAKQIHFNLKRSLETMKELFNALLDISKLEAGVLQPKVEAFSVQRLFDHLEVVFRQQAIEKDLDLRIVASKYILQSDPHLLEQVLANLVSNAIKHTKEGYVFVGCRREGESVRLMVWDTGPGIPKHEHGAIFKEFVQLDNPERDRSKGLGLGLSIVKRTCQLLHHTIRFSSIPGSGTRFEIVVQRSEKVTVKEPISKTVNAVLAMQRVLVIDDDPAILLGMKALLESWKLQPILARSIEDAIRVSQLKPLKPDLIVSDLRLQDGVTGVNAINKMHEHFNSNIPAILITGDTSPERIKLAYDSPFPLLHKPIKPAQLRSVCTSVLNLGNTDKTE